MRMQTAIQTTMLAISVAHSPANAQSVSSSRPVFGQWLVGPIADRPFSGVETRHSTQTLANGAHVNRTDVSVVYRDELGRMRFEGKDIVLIYDPVGGFDYSLDVRAKTYRKAPTGSMFWNNPTRSNTENSETTEKQVPNRRTEDLGSRGMSGINVQGTRITVTIPAGAYGNDRDLSVVNEKWYSPDLRALIKSLNSDPRFGDTTYELSNIVRSRPAPSLFQVPPDYTQFVETRKRK